MHLVLASASPRRAELLRAAGFEFETVSADVDEAIRPGESASVYVRRLAAEKSAAAMDLLGTAKAAPYVHTDPSVPAAPYVLNDADTGSYAGHRLSGAEDVGHRLSGAEDVGHRFSGALDPVILGADTAVVVDGAILGKPRDDDDAAQMLRQLSGRRHEVMTGVSLRRGTHEVGRVEVTIVHFDVLSDDDVAWYVASGEGRDKAGAYAIQGLGSRFIPRIEGSHSNVVGLPVACLVELLVSLLASRT